MKISAVRKLLILLDLLLLLGVAGTIWQAIETKKRLATSERQRLLGLKIKKDGIEVNQATRITPPSYGDLIAGGGNLLAAYNPKPVEKAPTAVPTKTVDRTPLEEKAELVSITSGGDRPYAYVKPKGTSELPAGEQRFFAENEALPFVEGAVIKQIKARSVVFMHQGKEVVLVLPEGVAKAATEAGGNAPVIPLKDYSAGISSTPGSTIVSVSYPAILGMQEAGADQVLQGVVWNTVVLKDRKKAVQVKTVPGGGALYKGGLRGGDTIKSINGVRVTSKADIVNYVKANQNLARYTVVYIRNGVTHTRTVTPKR